MENTRQIFMRSPHIRTLFIILGVCFFCISSLFTYEVFPRYIIFSFSPPTDDYEVGYWMFPSRATWRNWSDRYFVWRAETILVYKKVPDEKSRESIVAYFDKQLTNSDWVKEEGVPASCRYIMPEVNFLNYMEDFSKNGYITYVEKSDHDTFSWTNESVCVAIWSTSPGTFRVVILTAKPSPFTILFRRIID